MADTVVIGGGVIGATCALHLREAGLKRVILVDSAERLGAGTSSAGAGFVAYWSGEREARLVDHAIDFYGRVAETVGRDLGLRKSGMLLPVLGDREESRIRGMYEYERKFSQDIEWLDGAQTEELFPLFAPGSVRAALLQSRAHRVPVEPMMAALHELLLAAGVEVRLGVRAHGVDQAGGRVTGVRTDAGTLATDLVVNAAGAWAHGLASRDGISVGAVPLCESRFVTEPSPSVTDALPMVLMFGRNLLYMRPEGGGLLVGAIESELPATSLLPLDDPPAVTALPTHAVEHHEALARRCADIVPMLGTLPTASTASGMPTFTPDGHPVLGEAPGLAGYFVVAGCNEGGVSHAPGLARLLAQLVMSGETEFDITDYRVDRFSNLSDDELIKGAVATYLSRHG